MGIAKTPAEAVRLLHEMVRDDRHVYLDVLPAPASRDFAVAFDAVLGSKQVTDAYLLSLAQARHATLVTFDTRLRALAGPDKQVEILTS